MIPLPLSPLSSALLIRQVVLRRLGGRGSGNFGHSGRPGERGGSGEGTTTFHGTQQEKLQSILEEGLRIDRSGVNFPNASKKGHVYVASTEKEARFWAHQVVKMSVYGTARPVVLEVHIPKEKASRLTRDVNPGLTEEAKQFKGNVPAAWIRSYSVFTQEGKWEKKDFRANAERSGSSELVVFIPFAIEEELKVFGGKGSGNFAHSGRKGEVGGSGEGGASQVDKVRNARSLRALKAFIPVHAGAQRHAERNELFVRRMVGGTRTDDNLPVDVITKIGGRVKGIEVKTFLTNTNDKITMRKDAIARKDRWGAQNHASVHTVVIDDRGRLGNRGYSGHRLYYAKGSGSFRLSGMTRVKDAAHLKELLSK